MINIDIVKSQLKTNFIGSTIKYYDEVSSTNTVAKSSTALPDGSVFIAKTQTNGKGRLGRSWNSVNGGLWFSILLKPQIPPENISLITLIAGLAVCSVMGNKALIKWPNDIVINGKKLCGILSELCFSHDNQPCVICGIGINISQHDFPDELKNKATSLTLEGFNYDINELFLKILKSFEDYYTSFLKNGFTIFWAEYKSKCITLNKEVTAIFPDKEIHGKAVDISKSGELILSVEKDLINISSGEVSVRGIYGYI